MPTSVTNYLGPRPFAAGRVHCHIYNIYFTAVSQIIRTLDMKVSAGFIDSTIKMPITGMECLQSHYYDA